ncbi:hypothetical protein [Gordonia sputi]
MDIDCSTCPGRDHACDGCVMTVLFGPLNSQDAAAGARRGWPREARDNDAEIHAAIDTFTHAAMASNADARSARASICAVQAANSSSGSPTLRAG